MTPHEPPPLAALQMLVSGPCLEQALSGNRSPIRRIARPLRVSEAVQKMQPRSASPTPRKERGGMTITVHEEVVQGSTEWAAMRCGLLTASEMHLIVTSTLKAASNDKERSHLYELLAQRITQYVEPSYVSDAMLRGVDDEIEAVNLYSRNYAPAYQVGFITNDRWGFTLGYSPDSLVGNDGQIECKSRKQKYRSCNTCKI